MGNIKRFLSLFLSIIIVMLFSSTVLADATCSKDGDDGCDQSYATLRLSGYAVGDEVTVEITLDRNDVYVSSSQSVVQIIEEGSYTVKVKIVPYSEYNTPDGQYDLCFSGDMMSNASIESCVVTNVAHKAPTDTPTPKPVTDTPTPKPVTDTPTPKPVTDTPTPKPTTPAPTTPAPTTPAPTTTAPTDAPVVVTETDVTETAADSSNKPSATPTPTPTSTPTPTPTEEPTPTATPTPTPPTTIDGERTLVQGGEETEDTEETKFTFPEHDKKGATISTYKGKSRYTAGDIIGGILKFLVIIIVIVIIARIAVLKMNGTYNEDLLKEFIPRKKKEDPFVAEVPDTKNGYLQKSNLTAVRPMYSNAASESTRTRGVNKHDENSVEKSNMADARDSSETE